MERTDDDARGLAAPSAQQFLLAVERVQGRGSTFRVLLPGAAAGRAAP